MRFLGFAYSLAGYVAFLGTFTFLMGFVTGMFAPRTVDNGPAGPIWLAIAINTLLVLLFAVQHTIMARPRFKEWWARFVPRPMERSTFVLIACGILVLLMWQWRPIPATVWHVESRGIGFVIQCVAATGWLLAVYSTFLIDHFDLFGLRQTWFHLRGRPYAHKPFVERSVYRSVRHPLMVGFLIGFWATPHMTVGHLLLAGLITGYVMYGTRVEERDLLEMLGDDYRAYRQRTPAFVPRLRRTPTNLGVSSQQSQESVPLTGVTTDSWV